VAYSQETHCYISSWFQKLYKLNITYSDWFGAQTFLDDRKVDSDTNDGTNDGDHADANQAPHWAFIDDMLEGCRSLAVGVDDRKI
jgi:hypothetical protein